MADLVTLTILWTVGLSDHRRCGLWKARLDVTRRAESHPFAKEVKGWATHACLPTHRKARWVGQPQPPESRGVPSFARRAKGWPTAHAKSGASHSQNLLTPSASRPTRETATGGASGFVVARTKRVGWASRPPNKVDLCSGMPRLRESRSLGQPQLLWWRPRWASPPAAYLRYARVSRPATVAAGFWLFCDGVPCSVPVKEIGTCPQFSPSAG